ncbi:hypothetical protein LCGC14_1100260 [marine sediment metagenome]|uniref:Disease resistance R13L4/SHOC-2-like LRR domain-containing protein n=1 Tax=marine sediment metagenome TaxID=412755 RepID=A0A0F9ME78_9ZZZZ
MYLKPNKIYEDFRKRNLGLSKTIDLLITLIENIADDTTRKECIDILNKIDFKHNKVFTILENLLISDNNENVRYSAAKVIKTKFLNKAVIPFLWALQHESSYECLITIVKSLEEIIDERIVALMIEEVEKINIDKFKTSLNELFNRNTINNYSHKDFAEIIINNITLKFLIKKFDKINFKVKNGLISELDFSDVDNQVIYWRDRKTLEDPTDLIGIQNLKNLERIKFFPLKWVVNNDLTYKSSIALIQALEGLNTRPAKETLITQLLLIEEPIFRKSVTNLIYHSPIEKFSISQLSNILRNFITISFLRKNHPQLNFEVESGKIVKIKLEEDPLITLPEYINQFSSLQSLILKNCSLYSLPDSIGSFKHLEILGLEGNNLKALTQSISDLSSLKYLNLKNNELKKIPYSLGKLSNLSYLNLESNKLTEIPKSIGHISSLKYLNIGRNSLKKIPASLGSLKALQYLNMRLNNLNLIPESFGLLDSLEILDLDNNNLKNLPNSITSISTLKKLSIEDNQLIQLPGLMILFQSLEILKLGWNQLEFLPISIGSLKSLKTFRITDNNLQALPLSLCLLSSLEDLNISQNKLMEIPEQFGNLKSLKILNLSDNQLKELPDSICSLNLLEKLDLSGNNIETLPKSTGSMQSLIELSLNGNFLKELPSSIGNLNFLKKLKLLNNKLTQLPKSIKNISSLEEISLNWKKIENSFEFSDLVKKMI